MLKTILPALALLGMPLSGICEELEAPTMKHGASKNNISFTGKVNANQVRLRTQANLDCHVIQELSSGDLLVVVGEEENFYSVQPPAGVKGFIYRKFILDGVIEGDKVNVRLEPSTESPVVAQMNTGDKVEGKVSSLNNRWLEIKLPKDAKFFIAKEFVENIGPPEYLAQMEKRRHDLNRALNSAYILGQTELRKEFEDINIRQVSSQFQEIIESYGDFPDHTAKAQEALDLIKDTYLQKKIAFLEAKASQTNTAQVDLPSFDEEVAETTIVEEELVIEANESTEDMIAEEISMEEMNAMVLRPDLASVTDQMRSWEPMELYHFQTWANQRGDGSLKEFYSEEMLEAKTLMGILRPFSRSVKNRPGDYILERDNVPVAYLYSTRVNLENMVGQHVSLQAVPRPNNHFAFPAFFVLDIE